MTTFIDFRYSRALAAALFAGQEKEEVEMAFTPDHDGYVALDIGSPGGPRTLARLVDAHGESLATLDLHRDGAVGLCDSQRGKIDTVVHPGGQSEVLALRIGRSTVGIRRDGRVAEISLQRGEQRMLLECESGVKVLGRGTGRAARWGELFYHRGNPKGLCVELTMDWHHLRAGIPLFSTMSAEELVADGKFRLRFRSYAYEAADAEATDFVRLFGCDDPPDIAVHLTPAMYDPRREGIPNLGFGVIESENVHPHLVERCNRMDRICVPSSFTRDAFARAGVTRPIDVVLHGVDSEYFRPVSMKQPLPGGRAFNFLAIGTHVERKNIKHLVRAFLEEFKEREDVALFLLLRPEYHTTQNNVALEFTEWERAWAGDSAPIFLWTGYLTREHLRDFYANANAYVMPSNEGFGLTLLEAMACGTPAIGLDHGGVTDFVNESNGSLVPRGDSYVARDVDTLPYVGDVFHQPDPTALRQAMRQMYEDPELVSLKGQQARADASKLTWTSVTRELSASIEQTHAGYSPRASVPLATRKLTIVLCVLDDADARQSLDYLKSLSGETIRILCLFTRYARVIDVLLARRYGFVYYRWDGTIENCRVIARSIVGRSWIAVLEPDEKFNGDLSHLISYLDDLPPAVAEVSLDTRTGKELRVFHVRPQGEPSEKIEYSGLSVRSTFP